MNEVLQIGAEDHLTPFLRSLGAIHLLFESVESDVPSFPVRIANIEHGKGACGFWVKIMPSTELMAWATLVRSKADAMKIPYRHPAHLPCLSLQLEP